MLLDSIAEVLKRFVSTRRVGSRYAGVERPVAALKSIGFDDFLAIDMPPREMLLDPILPERSLAMLYAPRGIGKTLLALSMGLAVASGSRLLRWRAPRKRRVSMSMAKCRSSRYKNDFERFRLGLVPSFRMTDFGF